MQFNTEEITAVLVYLERRKTRQLVGRLYRNKNKFIFEYDEKYLYAKNNVSLGPEFPLTQRKFESHNLFVPFSDRIPSIENPAYPEYCVAMGISVSEEDPFVLLTSIGSRGPSSFIFAPEYTCSFSSKDLKAFRKNLDLSARDFCAVFEFTQAALTRVETRKSTGKDLLKRASIYANFPEVALHQLKYHGDVLHIDKRLQVEKYLYQVLMTTKK